ncbi:MAG: hypothetical protein KZQ88_04770 [Candidatus Thiodiazotropha sp. (ex Dulcina madagascariensis)]|nr:hypothetical protein [Candidatus Thiodiazotropha sp. (ex Dulcina madagascariensis)]MCU7927116.1 hypothetical protein [Candidatus Thiodiazotropha sp. (ex Dulcina madagascariensis)]
MFGSYLDAMQYPLHPQSQHKLNVYGLNRYCNEANGRFDVLEAAYDINGDVIQFSAYFEVHCEGADSALFGALRYNSSNKLSIKSTSTKDNLCSSATTSAECVNEGIQALLEHDKGKVALLQKNAIRLLNYSSDNSYYSDAINDGDSNPIRPPASTNLQVPKIKKIGREKITGGDTYKPTAVCITLWVGGHKFIACDPPLDLSGL